MKIYHCYITNPRYNYNEYTVLRCGGKLYSIVLNYWSADALYRLDNILIKHAHDTSCEQMIAEICNYMTRKYEYNQMLAELIALDKEYTMAKAEATAETTNDVRVKELKRKRVSLYRDVKRERDVLLQKYSRFHV